MNKTLTFSTTGSYAITIAYGAFIILIALIPSSIVAVQWLLPPHQPSTDPASILPGIAVMLWGLKIMTMRENVTVNPEEASLTWKRSVFGVTWQTVTYRREEIDTIETTWTTGIKYGNYTFITRGHRFSRVLLDGTHDKFPHEVQETARLLNIPIQPLAEKD
jgi:hypothetical protein